MGPSGAKVAPIDAVGQLVTADVPGLRSKHEIRVTVMANEVEIVIFLMGKQELPAVRRTTSTAATSCQH
jgi:hypothetical protein